jgi:hypothetical protein
MIARQDVAAKSTEDYDSSGPYFVKWQLPSAEKAEIQGQVRGFLWEHFAKKSLAKLEVTYYTLEGEPTHYLFFVDSDPAGEWRIRAIITMWRVDFAHHKKKPKQSVVQETYCRVKRMDQADKKMIPQEEKRDPKTYSLVLTVCPDRDLTF